MYIIVRACGERTERECIKQARKQGTVYVVREHPFGESIRKTYELAIELNQKWMPVIDADVILSPGTLSKAVKWLDGQKKNVFCLDGKTKDKIMMSIRRAGIHIYRTSLLPDAMRYIDDSRVKPESHVRKSMEKHGYKTVVGGIVFGVHDYEQYYVDLWRKSVCQTKKLGGVIRKTNITKKWALLAKRDDDYRVILAAHNHGIKHASKIIIDSRITYGAEEGIAALGLKEKGEM